MLLIPVNEHISKYLLFLIISDVKLVGKVHCVTNVNRILVAFMEHARHLGNVSARKVGVVSFVTKISTTAQIIGHVSMEVLVLTLARVCTRANVHLDLPEANVKMRQVIVQ